MSTYTPRPRTPQPSARQTRNNDRVSGTLEGDWGPWALDMENRALFISNEHCGYYHITLASCHDSAAVLNWIAHLNEQSWATAQIIGGFIAAVDDIIGVRSYQDGSLSLETINRRVRVIGYRPMFEMQQITDDPK